MANIETQFAISVGDSEPRNFFHEFLGRGHKRQATGNRQQAGGWAHRRQATYPQVIHSSSYPQVIHRKNIQVFTYGI